MVNVNRIKSGVIFGILALAGIFLAGCTTLTKTNDAIDTVSQSKQFKALCNIEPTLYTAFVTITSQPQVNVSNSTKVKASTAHSIIRATCNNPPADIATALVTALNAYNTILEAQQSAVAKVN